MDIKKSGVKMIITKDILKNIGLWVEINDYNDFVCVILFPKGEEDKVREAVKDFSKLKDIYIAKIKYKYFGMEYEGELNRILIEEEMKDYEILSKEILPEFDTSIQYLLKKFGDEFKNFLLERGFVLIDDPDVINMEY